MPEVEARAVCDKAGCRLVRYRESLRGGACQAVVRLFDRRRIVIHVEHRTAVIFPTRGLLDLFLPPQPIGRWDLAPIHKDAPRKFQLSRQAINLIVLDVLVNRLTLCDCVDDAWEKAAMGVLEPFEEVLGRIEKLSRASSVSNVGC